MNREKKFSICKGVQNRHIQEGLKNPLMHLRNLLQRSHAIAYCQLTLRLPSDLAEVLVENAQSKGMSVNSFVLQILMKNLQKREPKAKQPLLKKILNSKQLSAAFLWHYYSSQKQYVNVPNLKTGTLKKVLLRAPSVLESVEKGKPYQKIIEGWFRKLPQNEKQIWKEVCELWGKVIYKSKNKLITVNDIARACLSVDLDEVKPKEVAQILGVTYGTAYKLLPLISEFNNQTDYRVINILASLKMLDEVEDSRLKGKIILLKTFPELNLK